MSPPESTCWTIIRADAVEQEAEDVLKALS
jgi:hypothetical protein